MKMTRRLCWNQQSIILRVVNYHDIFFFYTVAPLCRRSCKLLWTQPVSGAPSFLQLVQLNLKWWGRNERRKKLLRMRDVHLVCTCNQYFPMLHVWNITKICHQMGKYSSAYGIYMFDTFLSRMWLHQRKSHLMRSIQDQLMVMKKWKMNHLPETFLVA